MSEATSLKEIFQRTQKDLERVRQARDDYRGKLAALNDPTLQRRWQPDFIAEQRAALKADAIKKYSSAAAAARSTLETVRQLRSEHTVEKFLRRAKLSEVLPLLPEYATQDMQAVAQIQGMLLEELRRLRIGAELKNLTPAELAAEARALLAEGSESAAAQLAMVRRELATRTGEDSTLAKIAVSEVVNAFPLPGDVQGESTLAEATAQAAESVLAAFAELEGKAEDLSSMLESIATDSQKFIDEAGERQAAHQERRQKAVKDFTTAAALAEVEEILAGEATA